MKTKMRKIAALLLSLALGICVFSFSACGDGNGDDNGGGGTNNEQTGGDGGGQDKGNDDLELPEVPLD